MRKKNSIASSAKATGIGASSHHSGHDQRLDRERAAGEARRRHAAAVPDEVEAADQADDVADPFQQPANASAAARAARCRRGCAGPCRNRPGAGKQRDEIEACPRRVSLLGGMPPDADVAKQHVGADHQCHHQQQQAREQQHRFEQATVPAGQPRHIARRALDRSPRVIWLGEELLQLRPDAAGFAG